MHKHKLFEVWLVYVYEYEKEKGIRSVSCNFSVSAYTLIELQHRALELASIKLEERNLLGSVTLLEASVEVKQNKEVGDFYAL